MVVRFTASHRSLRPRHRSDGSCGAPCQIISRKIAMIGEPHGNDAGKKGCPKFRASGMHRKSAVAARVDGKGILLDQAMGPQWGSEADMGEFTRVRILGQAVWSGSIGPRWWNAGVVGSNRKKIPRGSLLFGEAAKGILKDGRECLPIREPPPLSDARTSSPAIRA